jgi:hypothetical protein
MFINMTRALEKLTRGQIYFVLSVYVTVKTYSRSKPLLTAKISQDWPYSLTNVHSLNRFGLPKSVKNGFDHDIGQNRYWLIFAVKSGFDRQWVLTVTYTLHNTTRSKPSVFARPILRLILWSWTEITTFGRVFSRSKHFYRPCTFLNLLSTLLWTLGSQI